MVAPVVAAGCVVSFLSLFYMCLMCVCHMSVKDLLTYLVTNVLEAWLSGLQLAAKSQR